MRCRDCSQVRRYPYKRSHLVALRTTKISASDAVDLVAGRTMIRCAIYSIIAECAEMARLASLLLAAWPQGSPRVLATKPYHEPTMKPATR